MWMTLMTVMLVLDPGSAPSEARAPVAVLSEGKVVDGPTASEHPASPAQRGTRHAGKRAQRASSVHLW